MPHNHAHGNTHGNAHANAQAGDHHHEHSGDHGHDHAQGLMHHHGAGDASRSRLRLVLMLSAGYLVVEAVGGVLTNSLALLADAGHMLSDVGSLALAVFAMGVAQRPPTLQRTFGYQRAEILAALANGAALVAASVWILVEALQRLRVPHAVDGLPMLGIAAGGLLVNLIAMMLLHSGRDASLNMRGAWLHVATDALGSIGAMLAGLAVWRFGWSWADPVVSIIIAALVAFSSWRLLRETVDVLMESAPAHVDVAQVRAALADVPGVVAVHDLHVWSIGSGTVALAGHVQVAESTSPELRANLLPSLCGMLRDRFGIAHATIQVEPEGFDQAARCDAVHVR